MADITTVWSTTHGDWVQLGAALEAGDDLTTAVLISAFSDQAAQPDDTIPDAVAGQPGDPRGWWGDAGQPYPIGSRLWIVLSRAKQTADALQAAKDALQQCLGWMVGDGVVASVSVRCWYPARGQFAAVIDLYRQDGSVHTTQFQSAWGG
jgi:phage gp46-like protein